MDDVVLRAGAGARLVLMAVLVMNAVVALAAAPLASAATGSLQSIERDPNFTWSALNITGGRQRIRPGRR